MNGKQEAIKSLKEFFESDEKVLLITGTHQFNKHKLIMAFIDNHHSGKMIHFRTNGMDRLTDDDFVGFAGVKRKPKSGEVIRIHNNKYRFDSFNSRTWSHTHGKYYATIVYPIDAIYRGDEFKILDDIFDRDSSEKIILVSWTDHEKYKYDRLDDKYDRKIVYDAEEEDK